MNVQKAEVSAEPAYPDRKEFLRQRHLWGITALGAGMVMSACNPSRTAGVPAQPPRLGGVPPQANAADYHATTTQNSDQHSIPPPNRTPGKIKVEPAESNPPSRPLGETATKPPAAEPGKDGPPRTLGVPLQPR